MTFKENNENKQSLGVPHFAQRPQTIERSAPQGYRASAPNSPVTVAPRDLTLAEKQARSQLAQQAFIAPILNDETFDETIHRNQKPCIVLFSARSCGSCTSLKINAWQEIYTKYHDQFDLFEFPCTESTRVDKREDINAHPSMLFYSKGRCVGTYLGYSQFEYYVNYIKSLKF